ncbi:hypothetical protein BJ875DRAFT_524424 [Amylocarpus encephaloides]|uniref:Uncharacterized protein n=1 Tax=Amylocarpus encephaloides TaxID=45428 RepID=A0A9P7Y8E7_9HELO|nr:hypothetical protein BJ875DRAFT_524424 [Amylocarpus encephaloides]
MSYMQALYKNTLNAPCWSGKWLKIVGSGLMINNAYKSKYLKVREYESQVVKCCRLYENPYRPGPCSEFVCRSSCSLKRAFTTPKGISSQSSGYGPVLDVGIEPPEPRSYRMTGRSDSPVNPGSGRRVPARFATSRKSSRPRQQRARDPESRTEPDPEGNARPFNGVRSGICGGMDFMTIVESLHQQVNIVEESFRIYREKAKARKVTEGANQSRAAKVGLKDEEVAGHFMGRVVH